MSLAITIKNTRGELRAHSAGINETVLVYENAYLDGDVIILESDDINRYIVVQLEDSINPALVFMTKKLFTMPVPFEEKRLCYSPKSFTGGVHLLSARYAEPFEINTYRNLAYNPWDIHNNQSLFPHAAANVETRDESVFAARNAIDGIKANHSHGSWPFHSWGINRNPEAEWKLDFGREVVIDKAVIYLRADFPHDAWWEQVSLNFSDGSRSDVSLKKTPEGQAFSFEPKTIHWVLFHKLIKADDPSPFPALTQIEFWGTEIGNYRDKKSI